MIRRRLAGHGTSVALHLLALAIFVHLPTARPAPRRATRQVTVMTMTVRPTAKPPAGAVAAERVEQPGVEGDPSLYVGGFTFDVDRIARRRDLLFPFLTGDVSFERLTADLTQPAGPMLAGSSSARARERHPLHLSDAAIQRIVDRSWSRRNRWESFSEIRKLIDTYDGAKGDVPRVLRGYLDQNILQPYYDASIKDPRLWVMLGLSADHVDFIDFIGAYVHDHRATPTATDLLFLLDKLVQGNRDALVALLSADPRTDLTFTRNARADAYTLVSAIRDHYKRLLARRGVVTLPQVARIYDDVRLTLLTAIIEGTPDGYRADDARYLAGAIYWRRGEVAEAVRLWRQIVPRGDGLFMRLRAAVDFRGDDGQLRIDRREVSNALDAEDGRWLLFSFDRLRQFGYTFETY